MQEIFKVKAINENSFLKGYVLTYPDETPYEKNTHVFFDNKILTVSGFDAIHLMPLFEEETYDPLDYFSLPSPKKILMSSFLISSNIPCFKLPFTKNILKITEDCKALVTTSPIEVEKYNEELNLIIKGYILAQKDLFPKVSIEFVFDYLSANEETIKSSEFFDILNIIKTVPEEAKVTFVEEDGQLKIAYDKENEPIIVFLYMK